jgi:hypothetical protein
MTLVIPKNVACIAEYNKIFVFDGNMYMYMYIKGKVLPQQAEVAQGVPGSLRPRIFLTFGTTRVVGREPSPLEKSLVLNFRGLIDPRLHDSVSSYGKNLQ